MAHVPKVAREKIYSAHAFTAVHIFFPTSLAIHIMYVCRDCILILSLHLHFPEGLSVETVYK
jgi:hypothetical protein